MNITQELLYQQYVRRELETYRAPYDPEAEFYSYVRQGNTEKVKELCHESFQEKKGLGVLSDSPLQNLKYHFTITAAMLARYCIEGGMEVTEAYDLSDYYIHKADLMKSKKEISTLHPQMCLDYTTRMEKMHRNHACSRPVAQCLEYIYDHLLISDILSSCQILRKRVSDRQNLNRHWLPHWWLDRCCRCHKKKGEQWLALNLL